MLCFSFLSTGDRVPRRPQKGVFVPCLFSISLRPRGPHGVLGSKWAGEAGGSGATRRGEARAD